MYDGDVSRAQIPSTDNDALLSNDYTFDDIISYLEYLKSLQALESRLKQQLAEESLQLGEDQEEKEETTANTEEEEKHIRKKRSIGNDGEILQALSLLLSWLCCNYLCATIDFILYLMLYVVTLPEETMHRMKQRGSEWSISNSILVNLVPFLISTV